MFVQLACLLSSLLLTSTVAIAAATATTAPALLLGPWEMPGIDPDLMQKARPLLEDARKRAASEINATSDLATWADASVARLSIQRRHVAAQVMVGESGAAGAPSIILIPSWCQIGGYNLVFVEAISIAPFGLLLGSAHRVSGPESKRDALPSFVTILPSLATAALAMAMAQEPAAAESAMQLGLSSATAGVGTCLNTLLAGELRPRYRVLRPQGITVVGMIQSIAFPGATMARASRRLLLQWEPATDASPLSFRLQVRRSEAVLASPLLPPLTAELSTLSSTADGRLQLRVPPALEAFLNAEAQALRTDELPQVAKIDRAWVYLDRGRAWGLDLNDRVVVAGGNIPIKGHVVGFYGAALGLKSPRGYTISEGAIIYIRKGQKQTRLGQAFSFDPTAYPAPWPPAK